MLSCNCLRPQLERQAPTAQGTPAGIPSAASLKARGHACPAGMSATYKIVGQERAHQAGRSRAARAGNRERTKHSNWIRASKQLANWGWTGSIRDAGRVGRCDVTSAMKRPLTTMGPQGDAFCGVRPGESCQSGVVKGVSGGAWRAGCRGSSVHMMPTYIGAYYGVILLSVARLFMRVGA